MTPKSTMLTNPDTLPQSSALERNQAISTQTSTAVQADAAAPQHPNMPPPFITCHVLDTTTGRPARRVICQLKLLRPELPLTNFWTARTNSDGRVTGWDGSMPLQEVVDAAIGHCSHRERDRMIWSLTFDTEEYFGKGRTFWPQVELCFAAYADEEHYHVPVLLGPWSYTTYRGS